MAKSDEGGRGKGFSRQPPGARELLVYHDRAEDPAANLARESELFEQVDSGRLPEIVWLLVYYSFLVMGSG